MEHGFPIYLISNGYTGTTTNRKRGNNLVVGLGKVVINLSIYVGFSVGTDPLCEANTKLEYFQCSKFQNSNKCFWGNDNHKNIRY